MKTIRDKQFVRLISKENLDQRIDELANQLDSDFMDKNPLFIGVLNGSFVFLAELFKRLTIPCEVSFVKVKSYTGTQTTGTVKELIGLAETIEGRHVVIVEDIIDTGTTLDAILPDFIQRNPGSLSILTLLFKKSAFKGGFKINYTGFEIENLFVVGFGLDYDGLGRNYPEILVIKED